MKKNDGCLSKAGDALETAREETQRLGRMVSGMVSLASMSVTGENRKRVDFAALILKSAEALRTVLERQHNSLTVEIAPGLPDVFIENDRFTQVIESLLISSACHTRDGKITVRVDFDDGYITVCVTDTGEDALADMICKTVVEAHGGTIKMENETDRGTAVRFTVPVYGGQEAGHNL